MRISHLLRRLRSAPGFAALTLIALWLGIGANTAIFSVLNGVLLKPLPFPDSDRLAGVWLTAPGLKIPDLNLAPSVYFLLRDESKTLDHIGIWTGDQVTITGLAEPERVEALDVTFDLLNALAVHPILGRHFMAQEEDPEGPPAVILSYGYWMKHFAGDRNVIGKSLMVDSKSREIVGVLPQTFRFLNQDPQILLPLQFDRNKVFVGNFSFQGIGRLKPDISWAQANADLGRLLPLLLARFKLPPGFSPKIFEEARFGPNIRPLKVEVVGEIGTLLWVLMATIGIVLLIACANAANLMLVRAEGRQHELAIRTALGASRMEIARELILESILLGLAGGALGLGVAYAALRLLVAIAPAGLPRVNEIAIDPPVLFFTLVVSLLAGLLAGLIPVLKYASPNSSTTIRDGGRTGTQGRERRRARSALVVVQVAMALMLLVSAGLMMRSFRNLTQVNPGFRNPDQVLTFRIEVPEAQEKDKNKVLVQYRAMLDKISAIPGVESVALTTSVTMDGSRNMDPVFADDHTYTEGQLPKLRRYRFLGPGYAATMGNRLVAGRDFTWTEVRNRMPVAIVSENLARDLWGDPAKAIGRRVRENPKGTWREVVGVTGDERSDGMGEPATETLNLPLALKNLWDEPDNVRRNVAFVIRSSRTGTQSFSSEVRQAIWSVNDNLPLAKMRSLLEIQKRSMALSSFTLVMLALAGGMALLLGVVGIYGVISYSVSQRTREIGIRSALGATREDVQRLFVRHALMLAGFGVAAGLAGAVALTRGMKSLLFEVSPLDPVTLGVVPVVLVLAALLASYVPARRAARLEPIIALRGE
jgi:predicted permease